MLNLKALLTKICQELNTPVQTGTLPISNIATGSLSSAEYIKFGHFLQFKIVVYRTAATSSGDDIFHGIISDTNLRPSLGGNIGCSGNSGKIACMGHVLIDGSILVRNASGSSLAKNTNVTIYGTYLVP